MSKEGINKIIAQNPDVVLLDLELGDINGLDLTHLPIIKTH